MIAESLLDMGAPDTTVYAEDAAALVEQGIGWHRTGDADRAEIAYQRALLDDPANADAMRLLAIVKSDRLQRGKALRLLNAAVRLAPSPSALSTLGSVLMRTGDVVRAAAALRRSLTLAPSDVSTWYALLFVMDFHPHATPEQRQRDRRAFNFYHVAPLAGQHQPHTNSRDPERRLRVGYVSADFRAHSAAVSFLPILTHADHAEHEVYCYANGGAEDTVTAAIKARADHWRDVGTLDDDALADLIRTDGIDVLVDLSGYSEGNRLLTFVRRPAPVQVTGWGHATGTDLDCFDYLVSDEIAIPEDHERRHRERIVRLPSVLACSPSWGFPPVGVAPHLTRGAVTFGYLGRAVKVSDAALGAWAAILCRVPRSRLLLKSGEYRDDVLRERILSALIGLGVTTDRIEFRGATSRDDHLGTYNEIDVHLDPFPHGGGVTTAEASMLGVPTVTLLGEYVSGRISASVLAQGGHGAVTATPSEYVERAVHLAEHPPTPAERLAIRQATLSAPLMDDDGYARAWTIAARDIWRRWCADGGAA